MPYPQDLPVDIAETVRTALQEDIGSGDLTAGLIPVDARARGEVICREDAVLCGVAWFTQVFRQLDARVAITWLCEDGDPLTADQVVCRLLGPTRTILSGERTALNFLQLLSATASLTRRYVQALGNSSTRLLDTRKTLPGLRSAQKYAVACGGGNNHRMGLYDAILIKENHIAAAGGIEQALTRAQACGHPVEVEVETIAELRQALAAGAERILLDNFSLEDVRRAVSINAGRSKLEVSGGVDIDRLAAIAATGVDYISVGALTKDIQAVDFSMRIE